MEVFKCFVEANDETSSYIKQQSYLFLSILDILQTLWTVMAFLVSYKEEMKSKIVYSRKATAQPLNIQQKLQLKHGRHFLLLPDRFKNLFDSLNLLMIATKSLLKMI